jgi:Zn-finger nucleic acid-binding protein
MDCLKCDGKLRQVEVDGVMVDQCERCAGIWFDSGELARVLGMKSVEALKSLAHGHPGDDTKRGSCPRCSGQGKLVQVASLISDIHIDTCAVCGGQWLDGGELSILRQEGGLRPVVAFFRRLIS